MKIAVLALTIGGKKLAKDLAEKYTSGDQEAGVFLPQKLKNCFQSQPSQETIRENNSWESYYDGSIKDLVTDIFPKYEALVFIMATGIVVRTIAPLIHDKRTDPAVIVIDEKGNFVIPILSGHLGGANALANHLANLLGATPVITTSTDVQGKLAPDVLAREFNLVIEPWENLVQINSLLANGAEVSWIAEPELLETLNNKHPEARLQSFQAFAETSVNQRPYQGVIFITNKLISEPEKPYLFLRPRNLILGIGCRRGTATEEIIEAINKTLAQAGVSSQSIAKIASVDIKSDEQGILEAADYFKVPVEFYPREKIQKAYRIWPEMSKSDYVRKQIGVDGVCEPVSMLGGTKTTLLMKKQAFQGITTALAEDVCW